VEVEYDSTKDEANKRKHGMSLSFARSIDWAQMLCVPDDRDNYGELREIFTQRDNTFRIISLRKANAREVKRYVAQS
jgi:uncharacterized DUF497 family protein